MSASVCNVYEQSRYAEAEEEREGGRKGTNHNGTCPFRDRRGEPRALRCEDVLADERGYV
jgi:hypothetical protein